MKFRSNTCSCASAGPALRLFPVTDLNFRTTPERSWMLKCQACGSVYPETFPTAETLHEAYANYYTQPRTRAGLRGLVRQMLDATRRRHLARATPLSATSVLDYGCGSGDFLRLLAASGYGARLTGTDIARPATVAGDTFAWMTLEELQTSVVTFDWITLSHVIEHLPDAAPVLARLRLACRAGGGVWMSTPNADSVLVAAFGPSARDVDYPRHRQLFSRACLVELLGQAGFSASFEASPRIDTLMNFATCARNVLGSPELAGKQKLRVLALAAVRITLHLFKPAALRAKDSPETVVIARPR